MDMSLHFPCFNCFVSSHDNNMIIFLLLIIIPTTTTITGAIILSKTACPWSMYVRRIRTSWLRPSHFWPKRSLIYCPFDSQVMNLLTRSNVRSSEPTNVAYWFRRVSECVPECMYLIITIMATSMGMMSISERTCGVKPKKERERKKERRKEGGRPLSFTSMMIEKSWIEWVASLLIMDNDALLFSSSSS